ncbi:MAG: helix-turn-helix transcriptional regulator [Clostridia bacterium]|nr:helix-turn-helix transcriptional regulator [Clostridia bacterium]
MSEKRPVYIQIMSPKLDSVIDALTKAKGPDRGWAEYANDCGISPSTMSRIINGKLKSPLSIRTLQKLYDHRAETCKMSFDDFIMANGMIERDKQRDIVDEHVARRDELDRIANLIERSIVNGLYDRSLTFTRLEHIGDGTPNEQEIMMLFGNIMCSQLLRIGEGENSQTCGFEYVPIRLDEEERESGKYTQSYVRLAIENYATIFLADAWGLDERMAERVVFVFIDRIIYEAFLESFKKRHLNHYMTALLVDIEDTLVLEERPIGDQTGKSFTGLFEAPVIQRTGRRFGEQLKLFSGDE